MLVDALLDANRRCPHSLAVADGSRTLSYKQLTTLAAVCRDVITRTTDCPRVGIMLPASTAFPAVFFGALWAGRTAIPLNFLLQADELTRIIADAQIDCIFTVGHFRELVEALPVRAVYLEELSLKRRMLFAMLKRRPPVPPADPQATAVILYTSGTTADPKGVELTYGNLHSNCVDAIYSLDIDPRQVFLN